MTSNQLILALFLLSMLTFFSYEQFIKAESKTISHYMHTYLLFSLQITPIINSFRGYTSRRTTRLYDIGFSTEENLFQCEDDAMDYAVESLRAGGRAGRGRGEMHITGNVGLREGGG